MKKKENKEAKTSIAISESVKDRLNKVKAVIFSRNEGKGIVTNEDAINEALTFYEEKNK